MSNESNMQSGSRITRREFVQAAAAAGVALSVPAWAHAQEAAGGGGDELAVAMIGPGSQGRWLLTNCLKIPNVRFVAICDVWPYHQEYAQNILKKYDQPVNVYADYREMLERERHLDAVIVATPDWVHAEQAVACLRAGKHVYCEKEMSNTVEGARQMVLAARETGRHLQIGHQRRSSPRYIHALRMIEKDRILGRMTHCFAQWNRARLEEQGWPQGKELDAETLRRYGYGSMDEFRNWRWYRKYSGGPMADLGSHQIDIFDWFLRGHPRAVLASGGLDYYREQAGRDWYDNVMAIYEYETPGGPVRGLYQVLNTTSHGGFYEQFMGDEGSLTISDDGKTGYVLREAHAKRREWEDEAEKVEQMGREAIELKIGETLTGEGEKAAGAQELVEASMKRSVQLHLENFFDAIRGRVELTCPPEVAYGTCVAVMRANDAVAAGCRYVFDPKEFVV